MVPWQSASELSRLRLKRPERLVRLDAKDAIFFFLIYVSFFVPISPGTSHRINYFDGRINNPRVELQYCYEERNERKHQRR